MKLQIKVALGVITVFSLTIWGIVLVPGINRGLAEEDLQRFLKKRGYEPHLFWGLDRILQDEYQKGTPRIKISRDFKDCSYVKFYPFTSKDLASLDDSVLIGSRFEEDYIYKLGWWGKLEIRAWYDSSSNLVHINGYSVLSKYDFE